MDCAGGTSASAAQHHRTWICTLYRFAGQRVFPMKMVLEAQGCSTNVPKIPLFSLYVAMDTIRLSTSAQVAWYALVSDFVLFSGE